MAAVIRDLWGTFPKFLRATNRNNAMHLIAHLPSVKGVRIMPSLWLYDKSKLNSYFIVDRIEFDPARAEIIKKNAKNAFDLCDIYASTVVDGKIVSKEPKRLDQSFAFAKTWVLYNSPGEYKTLERKLNIQ